MAIMAQHLHGVAPRLDKVNPSVSPQLAAIVATCLAREPKDRYTDMDALINALDHPENVDTSILDNIKASSRAAYSLEQLQVVKGVFIGIGILGVLIILALALQYFHR
jgi:hypothetical protein